MTRKQCEANVYHITERGVGRQIIFEDNADRRRFAEKMIESFAKSNVGILAWCLMDNHVHILAQGTTDNLSMAMQSLNTSYARYFNGRHDRTGVLFQGRYNSVPVRDDQQLMAVVRYIHKNPDDIEPGIFSCYAWSSFQEYLGGKSAPGKTVNTQFVLDVFGGVKQFLSIHEAKSTAICAPAPDNLDSIEEVADSILGNVSRHEIKALPKAIRDEKIRALHQAGLSIRQIERLTSIGRSIIARASKM